MKCKKYIKKQVNNAAVPRQAMRVLASRGYSPTNASLKGQCHALIPLNFIYKKTLRDGYGALLFNISRHLN